MSLTEVEAREGIKNSVLRLNKTLKRATSDWDEFTHVYGRGELALHQIARDGLFTIIPVEGPRPGSRTCTEICVFSVGFVYVDREESAARMLSDIRPLRLAMRTPRVSTELDAEVLPATVTVAGPSYDFDTLPEAVIVVWRAEAEYHVEPLEENVA